MAVVVSSMQFHAYPVWLNVGIFFVAAVFVWLAGTRRATCPDASDVRAKLDHALPRLR
jgi:hypothetical protein